jgi:hypothetical protein
MNAFMLKPSILSPGFVSFIWMALTICISPVKATDSPAEGVEFFEMKIRPILVEHCFQCHSSQAKKPKGGLLLDNRASLLKGGDSGPVVVPGQPGKSRLIEGVGYENVDLMMPPKGKLPDTAITALTTWVKMGAPWPAEAGPKSAAGKDTFDLAKRRRAHWAWQPIRPPILPQSKTNLGRLAPSIASSLPSWKKWA